MSDRVHFKNRVQVVDEILSYLPAQWRAGFTGKVVYRLVVAFGLSLEAAYALLAKLLRLAIPATSEGIWLREWVRGVNMVVQGGIPATVVVRFRRYLDLDGPPAPAVQIPAGVEVVARNGQRFFTVAAAVLAEGAESVDVVCQAVEPGELGNVGAGEVVGLARDLGFIDAVTNPNPALGGRDGESDAEIKRRLPIHIESLHRATIPATEAAIREDKERFPDLFAVRSERRVGVPGYVKFWVCDQQGGDSYRPSRWSELAGRPGVYWTVTGWGQIGGVVVDGWPATRLGRVERDRDGSERWVAVRSVGEINPNGYDWYQDGGRLYASFGGRDPNGLAVTVVAGLLERVRIYLEREWIAAGVQVDVVAPAVAQTVVELSYGLEPGHRAEVVEAALVGAVSDYVGRLRMGEPFELEGLYSQLHLVGGAGGILVHRPQDNVVPPFNGVVRLAEVPYVWRRE